MRAIIVGIDGLVGQALKDALVARGDEVFGTTRRPDHVQAGKVGLLDLAGELPVGDFFPAADVAFICAAITSLADCRSRPDLATQVNFRMPAALAARFSERGVRTIFLSTNAVFDCRAPNMRADRIKAPLSIYGRLKSAAEDAVLSTHHPATIVRLTKILAPAMPLLGQWIGALRQGQPIEAATDHRISPLRLGHAVRSLLAIAERGDSGIYQVSAAGDVSYAEMAIRLAGRMGASPSHVAKRQAVDFGIPRQEVMPYTSLDASRLADLTGIAPPDPYDAIDHVVDELLIR